MGPGVVKGEWLEYEWIQRRLLSQRASRQRRMRMGFDDRQRGIEKFRFDRWLAVISEYRVGMTCMSYRREMYSTYL